MTAAATGRAGRKASPSPRRPAAAAALASHRHAPAAALASHRHAPAAALASHRHAPAAALASHRHAPAAALASHRHAPAVALPRPAAVGAFAPLGGLRAAPASRRRMLGAQAVPGPALAGTSVLARRSAGAGRVRGTATSRCAAPAWARSAPSTGAEPERRPAAGAITRTARTTRTAEEIHP